MSGLCLVPSHWLICRKQATVGLLRPKMPHRRQTALTGARWSPQTTLEAMDIDTGVPYLYRTYHLTYLYRTGRHHSPAVLP